MKRFDFRLESKVSEVAMRSCYSLGQRASVHAIFLPLQLHRCIDGNTTMDWDKLQLRPRFCTIVLNLCGNENGRLLSKMCQSARFFSSFALIDQQPKQRIIPFDGYPICISRCPRLDTYCRCLSFNMGRCISCLLNCEQIVKSISRHAIFYLSS